MNSFIHDAIDETIANEETREDKTYMIDEIRQHLTTLEQEINDMWGVV